MLTLPERNSYIRTIVCFPLCRTNIITCWFQGRYKESNYAVAIEQVLVFNCALLSQKTDKQRVAPANLLLHLISF